MKKIKRFNADLLNRANNCIAQGALTNSTRPESFIWGVYPTHLTKGEGCHVYDAEENSYIDFLCGLGTNLVGYGHRDLASAAFKGLAEGPSLSLSTIDEILLAEDLKAIFPFADVFKFLKTGSEACSAAIRMARAYTGKEIIYSEGYHGWHDDFVSLTPPANGVPPRDSIRLLCGTLDQLKFSENIAAVIVEPVITDMSDQRRVWLNALREICTHKKILLIFDEIITGFRFPKLSVSNYWGIAPDLICLGKAMGGGLPLSAVGGKKAILNSDYFVSSTHAGDLASIKTSRAFLNLIKNFYPIQRLWDKGEVMRDKLNSITGDLVGFSGYNTRGVLLGEEKTKAIFMQEAIKCGLLFGPSWFFCHSHLDIFDQVVSSVQDIILRMKSGSVKLEGPMPVKPYAQKARKQ